MRGGVPHKLRLLVVASAVELVGVSVQHPRLLAAVVRAVSLRVRCGSAATIFDVLAESLAHWFVVSSQKLTSLKYTTHSQQKKISIFLFLKKV